MKSAGCNCAQCPFAKDGRPSNFVKPTLPDRPLGLVVVGGGPSHQDVKDGEILGGMVGRELDGVLAEAGLERSALAWIPAWACQGFEPRKETDERQAVECCRPLVAQSLAKYDKRIPVLLAGKWAQRSVDGREQGLFANRGFRDDKWQIGDPLRKDKDER